MELICPPPHRSPRVWTASLLATGASARVALAPCYSPLVAYSIAAFASVRAAPPSRPRRAGWPPLTRPSPDLATGSSSGIHFICFAEARQSLQYAIHPSFPLSPPVTYPMLQAALSIRVLDVSNGSSTHAMSCAHLCSTTSIFFFNWRSQSFRPQCSPLLARALAAVPPAAHSSPSWPALAPPPVQSTATAGPPAWHVDRAERHRGCTSCRPKPGPAACPSCPACLPPQPGRSVRITNPRKDTMRCILLYFLSRVSR